MPKVDLIIATHNRCTSLLRAIESARNAGRNVEIIIVDDASSDQTPEVCTAQTGINYIRLRHRVGLGPARNVGLIAGTSPYLSFLDDDDLRLPGSLDSQVDLLEARIDAGMTYGKVLYGDDEGNVKGGGYPENCPQGDLFWEIMSWNFIPCPAVVFRRECVKRLGFLEDNAPGVEDWDLWVRIAEVYPVLAVEEPVAIWRQSSPRSGQFTSHEEKLHREARRLHRDKWLKLPRASAVHATERRRAARDFASHASQQLVWSAGARLKAGMFFESVKMTLAGTRMYPLSLTRHLLSFTTLRSLRNNLEAYRRAE
ncbi:MAG TPA: glycosyltransferase [Pyrinomonadaceae bacterium]|nr:glycosyltransferase [Pyrinomonadaceae bacterium]